MGETLQRALEADGTQLLDIPGEAHEQAGSVEVCARCIQDLLLRVLAQVRPETRTEWLECVPQTMEAQDTLIRKCGCSPFQLASHRDPEVPGDLLQSLPDVISSSSVLHGDVAAHTDRVRSIARQAVLQYNDNLAVRRVLDQRPRPFRDFAVGDEAEQLRHSTNEEK